LVWSNLWHSTVVQVSERTSRFVLVWDTISVKVVRSEVVSSFELIWNSISVEVVVGSLESVVDSVSVHVSETVGSEQSSVDWKSR